MTFKLGLTGSIGMGKSTTARLFKEEGCAVWDADAAVHRLYAKGGAAVDPIARIWPDVVQDAAVSRENLKSRIAEAPSALGKLENIVHPLVRRDRHEFLARTDADIAVFDIPLLFETGTERSMDAVVTVTASPEEQKRRVLARGTMTEAEVDAMIAKQMSDADKRARADYVIMTDTLDHAREQVRSVLADVRRKMENA
ncbi:dephospho-CoA kinase [Roseovarius sp. SYSU LYC5161]|uniref:dephospho-CoA kinase n=1 Tax=Roseovarius halophilus (ex Wu et al. 2025) TaxID=3376060 RepID=UPI00399B8AD4